MAEGGRSRGYLTQEGGTMSQPIQVISRSGPSDRAAYDVQRHAFFLKEELRKLMDATTPVQERACLRRVLMQKRILDFSIAEMMSVFANMGTSVEEPFVNLLSLNIEGGDGEEPPPCYSDISI